MKYAQAHGAHGYRVTSAKGMPALLKSIVAAPGVHLVDVPIDYSDNDRILSKEIRTLSAAI